MAREPALSWDRATWVLVSPSGTLGTQTRLLGSPSVHPESQPPDRSPRGQGGDRGDCVVEQRASKTKVQCLTVFHNIRTQTSSSAVIRCEHGSLGQFSTMMCVPHAQTFAAREPDPDPAYRQRGGRSPRKLVTPPSAPSVTLSVGSEQTWESDALHPKLCLWTPMTSALFKYLKYTFKNIIWPLNTKQVLLVLSQRQRRVPTLN